MSRTITIEYNVVRMKKAAVIIVVAAIAGFFAWFIIQNTQHSVRMMPDEGEATEEYQKYLESRLAGKNYKEVKNLCGEPANIIYTDYVIPLEQSSLEERNAMFVEGLIYPWFYIKLNANWRVMKVFAGQYLKLDNIP